MIFPKISILWPLLILEISIINMIWIDLKMYKRFLLRVINFNKFYFYLIDYKGEDQNFDNLIFYLYKPK
jgi:hypothetical protein